MAVLDDLDDAPAMRSTAGFRWPLWPSPLRRDAAHSLGRSMPATLWRLVLRLSAGDQVWLCVLSIAVALLDTVPLELQRRIVNRAIKDGHLQTILTLCALYAGVVLAQGLMKFLSNMYRAWVGENAVRALRIHINAEDRVGSTEGKEGIKVSMVLAESEPIGGFVGDAVSEPVLHAGLMISVTAYLIYLQPLISLVVAGVFLPQMVLVPLFQRMINKRAAAAHHNPAGGQRRRCWTMRIRTRARTSGFAVCSRSISASTV